MPSRSHVVVVALEGASKDVVAAIHRALGDGLAVLLITSSRKGQAAQQELSEALEKADFRIETIRVRTMRWVRDQINRRALEVISILEGGISRAFRFTGNRLLPKEREFDVLIDVGAKASTLFGKIARTVLVKAIDPLVFLAGTAVTKPREINRVRTLVGELASTDLVFAVLCLDATSLLPGWVIGQSYRGVPVLTEYPVDWSRTLVESIERLAGNIGAV